MDSSLMKQAEQILDMQVLKESIGIMKPYIPFAANVAMEVYKGFMNEGFSEQQAFEFAKEYTLRLLFQKN